MTTPGCPGVERRAGPNPASPARRDTTAARKRGGSRVQPHEDPAPDHRHHEPYQHNNRYRIGVTTYMSTATKPDGYAAALAGTLRALADLAENDLLATRIGQLVNDENIFYSFRQDRIDDDDYAAFVTALAASPAVTDIYEDTTSQYPGVQLVFLGQIQIGVIVPAETVPDGWSTRTLVRTIEDSIAARRAVQ